MSLQRDIAALTAKVDNIIGNHLNDIDTRLGRAEGKLVVLIAIGVLILGLSITRFFV